MPNYCYNSMIVEGPPKDLAEFRKGMGEGDDIGLLDTFLPTPTELIPEPMVTDDGKVIPIMSDEQHAWCVNTWGTKWPEGDLVVFDDPTVGHMTFVTAWGPPLNGIERISELLPALTFSMDWQGEGNDFVGAAAYRHGQQLALIDRETSHLFDDKDIVDKNGMIDWDAMNERISQERDDCASEAALLT